MKVLYTTTLTYGKEPRLGWDIDHCQWLSRILIREACDVGVCDAQYQVAHEYKYGENSNTDFVRALELYQKAADQNYAPAQFSLGMIYQYDGDK